MRSTAVITLPVENRRRPRKSVRRAARRKTARKGWVRALFSLFLAVLAVGAAGRALSAQGGPPSGGISGGTSAPVSTPGWIRVDLLPLNEYSRPGDPLPQVNGVVVHYVGNPGTTAEQNRSYFANLAQSGEAYASSHFVIGTDGTVIQCVPLDEIAYCSTSRNADTISIECCHPDEEGQFTQETMDSLVRLLNWLIDTYGLAREDVIRHYDVAGKECPIYYVRHPEAWEALLDSLTFST